jgi:hypothetical protein
VLGDRDEPLPDCLAVRASTQSRDVSQTQASFDELEINFDGNLELGARAFPYRAGDVIRERVIATYRQTLGK